VFDLLLVGAGQLGSRYLQGLVQFQAVLRITVVDPSVDSLRLAKTRWVEAGGEGSHHQIQWFESLPSGQQQVDVALVVTSSKGRADLIQRISRVVKVRYWVLEKVLAQSSGELELIHSALKDAEGVWVNTSRRMMKWHKSFKDVFSGQGPFEASYAAGLWGLACNGIHFLDLMTWWSDETLVSVDTSGLDSCWQNSKRSGYSEVTGELLARFSGGSLLRLSSKNNAPEAPLLIKLLDGTVWEINELAGVARSSRGQRLDGQLEFQSQISARLVDHILVLAKCELPTLGESSAMHAIFLNAMLAHWNLSQNRNDDLVPIT